MEDFEIILRKELKTYNSLPVNYLVFSSDAKYLIGGGDDELVRVWNMDTFDCDQILENDKWGQITALTLIDGQLTGERHGNTRLCIGTGRGLLSIIPMTSGQMKPFATENGITSSIFDFNDSVEVQAYNNQKSMLALASHSGELKIFDMDESSLTLKWSANYNSNIPSCITFVGASNETLLTMLLETSELYCHDSITGKLISKKALSGGIGGAALSSDQTLMLLNNLSTGRFELYRYPDAAAIKTFPIVSTRHFTKQCRFLEGTNFAVCGSDTNVVYIVDIAKNRILQTLLTGKENNLTQTVAVAESSRELIAAESGGSVFVWEKAPLSQPLPGGLGIQPLQEPLPYNNGNWKVILLVIVLTYSSWSPYLLQLISLVSTWYYTTQELSFTETPTVIFL